MALSQNGWVANDVNRTENLLIPGTTRSVRLARGDAGFLLRHFAAWFDKHVESVDDGIYDDWGYAERPIRGASVTLSNHASGTALDLNAPRHPIGRRGTFTAKQVAAIWHQLRTVYDGAIRWGGDYAVRPDEMHFEINTHPAAVAAVAARLRSISKDWFDMATKQELEEVVRAVLREELAVTIPAEETAGYKKYANGKTVPLQTAVRRVWARTIKGAVK